MNLTIKPAKLCGAIAAIPSKSDAHRLLILAALSGGETRLIMPQRSEDIDATIRCLRALGATIELVPDGVRVRGITKPAEDPLLDCGESGSTFRFLLPVAAALCERVRFTGTGRLPERPVGELIQAMREHGVSFSSDRLPFSMEGRLEGGDFTLPGDVSSQYLTGLLLALPMLREPGAITLTTRLESAAYVDITMYALRRFGVEIAPKGGTYRLKEKRRPKSPGELRVEGDWSNAAFFLAAGALGAPVCVRGLNPDSPQGDKAILRYLAEFGAKVTPSADAIWVSPAPLRGCEIDVSETPDLLPALAVLGVCASGETRLVNASRLRLKESDRLSSVAAMLRTLGGEVTEQADALIIRGGELTGGEVDCCRDHRVAMAAAAASVRCRVELRVLGADAANKSYPAFFTDFNRLGGHAHVV